MRAIIPLKLWLGNAHDARDPRLLYEAGVAAVVDVAFEEPPASLPRDFVYCRFPLVDGGGNDPQRLRLAVETATRLLAGGTPTLVACGAGMSRSPCIAAMALASHQQISSAAALELLAAGAPHDVSLALWDDVQRACAANQETKPPS